MSEGLERGQPWWPREGDTVPEGTLRTVWGLGAGDGLRVVGMAVPVLGLSLSPPPLEELVTAAPQHPVPFCPLTPGVWRHSGPAARAGTPHGDRGVLVRLAVLRWLSPSLSPSLSPMELPHPRASPANVGSVLFFSFSPGATHPTAYLNVSRQCQLLVHKCILGKKRKRKKKFKKKNFQFITCNHIYKYINIYIKKCLFAKNKIVLTVNYLIINSRFVTICSFC